MLVIWTVFKIKSIATAIDTEEPTTFKVKINAVFSDVSRLYKYYMVKCLLF